MVTTNKIGICKICQKEKKVNGNNLCNWCYRREIWKPKLVECPRCRRMLPHHSKGLCKPCYNYVFFIETTRDHNYRKYHNISPELYRKLTQKCLICGFDKYVVLHHRDENHKNNSEDNLIGLCPNHHQMIHTLKWKQEVLSQIRQALSEKKSPLPCEEETEAITLPGPMALPINQRNFLA